MSYPTLRTTQLIVLIMLIHFTFAFILMIPQVLLPFWKETFQLSNSTSTLLGSMFFIAYGCTSLIQGILLEKIGLRNFLVWASFLIFFGSVIFLLYPTFTVGLIAFFVMGIGVTALQISGSLVVKQLDDNPQSYSRNYSLVLVIIGLGGLSGGLLIGVIVNQLGLAWLSLYYLFALLALFLGVTAFFSTFDPASGENVSLALPWQAYFAMIIHPDRLRYIAGIFIYLGVEIGIATWITTFLITTYQMDKIEAAKIVSLYWFLQTVGRLLGGFFLSYFQASKMLMLFAVGCAMSVIMALFSGQVGVSSVAFGAAGFFTSIMFPVIFSTGIHQFGKQQESLAAGILCTAIIGGAVSPAVIGLLSDTLGSLSLGLVLVIVSSLAYILYLGWYGLQQENVTL